MPTVCAKLFYHSKSISFGFGSFAGAAGGEDGAAAGAGEACSVCAAGELCFMGADGVRRGVC